ncbi:MAG: response regulator [Promethearchaeota archaeon]
MNLLKKLLLLRNRKNRPKFNVFKINRYLELRLESGKTNIYVRGKLFNQCKYLLLNVPCDKIEDYDEIKSIDEAAEKLDSSREGEGIYKYNLSPETGFWGHCSNIQAWYENDYDTRILQRDLAFPLLKALVEAGDPLAKKVLKEEIAKRFSTCYPSVVMYLLNNRYFKYLNQEELDTVFENPELRKILSKWCKSFKFIPECLLRHQNEIEYTLEEKKEYERETGRYANLGNDISIGFIRWIKDKKIPYYWDKVRKCTGISEEMKKIWHEFMKIHHYSTFSKLTRKSVNIFIEKKSYSTGNSLRKMDPQIVYNLSHPLKEPLTSIKGYSQLLLENYKEELRDEEVFSTIKKIFNRCINLEEIVVQCIEDEIVKPLDDKDSKRDILLIFHDLSILQLLKRFFELKGFNCKGFQSGLNGLEELKNLNPEVILLDIMLAGVSGYELCKKIKNNERYKKIPLYFLFTFSEFEVKKKLAETGADGYINLPCSFSDFEFIYEEIQFKQQRVGKLLGELIETLNETLKKLLKERVLENKVYI